MKCLSQAKTALRKYFKGLLEGRKTMKNTQSDILGVLSAAQEDPQARAEVKDLDDETISDNLVMVWFGAYDTTSTTLTWVLKFINDNPDVFRKLQVRKSLFCLQICLAEFWILRCDQIYRKASGLMAGRLCLRYPFLHDISLRRYDLTGQVSTTNFLNFNKPNSTFDLTFFIRTARLNS